MGHADKRNKISIPRGNNKSHSLSRGANYLSTLCNKLCIHGFLSTLRVSIVDSNTKALTFSFIPHAVISGRARSDEYSRVYVPSISQTQQQPPEVNSPRRITNTTVRDLLPLHFRGMLLAFYKHV